MENREIKFKIWDNENSCFYKPTYEAYKGNLEEILMSPSGDLNMRTFKEGTHIEILNHESNFPDRFIIMQYTGRDGKNWVSIYEKDIIRKHGTGKKGLIGFKNGYFVVKWEDGKETIFGLIEPITSYEVVGNVCENTNLFNNV